MTTKRYLRSQDPMWATILEVTHKYKELFDNKKIVKNGGYYPRLTDTKKRGFKAYEELLKKEFNGLGSGNIIDEIKVCKTPPVVEIDTMVLEEIDYYKMLNKGIFKNQISQFEESTTPFQMEVAEINPTITTKVKIECVMTMLSSLEFSLQELLNLNIKIGEQVLEKLDNEITS